MSGRAKFGLGQVVRHKTYPFRGVIYDVDPIFSSSEEWYQSIPLDQRPVKNQPFYHLLAQNSDGCYEAYVSEQNLQIDEDPDPVEHPSVTELFDRRGGTYEIKSDLRH